MVEQPEPSRWPLSEFLNIFRPHNAPFKNWGTWVRELPRRIEVRGRRGSERGRKGDNSKTSERRSPAPYFEFGALSRDSWRRKTDFLTPTLSLRRRWRRSVVRQTTFPLRLSSYSSFFCAPRVEPDFDGLLATLASVVTFFGQPGKEQNDFGHLGDSSFQQRGELASFN